MKRGRLFAEGECFLCGNPRVEYHHVYPSSRRQISEREGCVVPLCHEHHQGRRGVHSGHRRLDRLLKAECQIRWEQREIEEFGITRAEARERFRKTFYDSYLEEVEEWARMTGQE